MARGAEAAVLGGQMNETLVSCLRCPVTGGKLRFSDGVLITEDGSRRYRVTDNNIPLFAEIASSEDGRRQQQHYDGMVEQYLENLDYPHTTVYRDYLNDRLLMAANDAVLDNVAELCCGRGEAFSLLFDRINHGIGLDISLKMLNAARKNLPEDRFQFVQGDATKVPLKDGGFDTIFMVGGIHHINDRLALFREIHRILKPGGRFYWLEPVSDFFLWRWLRTIIYRLSPALDHETEHPLLYKETIPVLERAGMELMSWQTYGFLGFCLFMNSNVLVFNRVFRFIPGIRILTRLAVILDDWTVRLPGMSQTGLQVVGVAQKPNTA